MSADALSSLCVSEITGVVSVKLYVPQMVCHPSVCLRSRFSESETLPLADGLSSLCVFEITGVVSVKLYVPQMFCHPSVFLISGA